MSKRNVYDQYYTKDSIAIECISIFKRLIPQSKRVLMIEPSAGAGAFYRNYSGNKIGFDLEPKCDGVIKKDFFFLSMLDFSEQHEQISVLGNPPFGFECSLAVKFFNESAQIASTVAFIVPNTFKKHSIQDSLHLNFHLIHQHDLPKKSFLLDGEEYDVRCCFQIWEYRDYPRIVHIIENVYLEFIDKKDATDKTFCVRRAGGKAGQVLKGLDHASVSTYFVNPLKDGVREAVKKIDLSVVSHTAGVNSISQKELVLAIDKVFV